MNNPVGIALRETHLGEIIRDKPPIGWLEVLADNYLADGGLSRARLDAVRCEYPVALHCVGMSLGSVDPLDYDYLATIKRLADRCQAMWVSDHLCFSAVGGTHTHNLLPLPCTEEAVECAASKIRQVQDFLGKRILIENVASYLTYRHSTMDDIDFLSAVVQRADCYILLDLNNHYVNACNHGYEAIEALERLPLERVREVHLGGFEDHGEFLLDAHSSLPSEPVWQLLEWLTDRGCRAPVLIEIDRQLPPLQKLLKETERASRIVTEHPEEHRANHRQTAQVAYEPEVPAG